MQNLTVTSSQHDVQETSHYIAATVIQICQFSMKTFCLPHTSNYYTFDKMHIYAAYILSKICPSKLYP